MLSHLFQDDALYSDVGWQNTVKADRLEQLKFGRPYREKPQDRQKILAGLMMRPQCRLNIKKFS